MRLLFYSVANFAHFFQWRESKSKPELKPLFKPKLKLNVFLLNMVPRLSRCDPRQLSGDLPAAEQHLLLDGVPPHRPGRLRLRLLQHRRPPLPLHGADRPSVLGRGILALDRRPSPSATAHSMNLGSLSLSFSLSLSLSLSLSRLSSSPDILFLKHHSSIFRQCSKLLPTLSMCVVHGRDKPVLCRAKQHRA